LTSGQVIVSKSTRGEQQTSRVVYDIAMRFAIVATLVLMPLAGQDKPPERRPPPEPKNLKVLKVTKGPEVIQIMRTFTAGLGVKCEHCHVQGNFASDDNPKKEIARHMISMAMEINSKFPDGKMHVSCYTCHRGEVEPKTAPEAKLAQ
jgi:Photosynthetic reaction centre cytochrome C subunit